MSRKSVPDYLRQFGTVGRAIVTKSEKPHNTPPPTHASTETQRSTSARSRDVR
jgi:hypothetical protein